MPFTNKDIDFLFDLEIKIQHQAYLLKNKIKPTAKDLFTEEEFWMYYDMMEKLCNKRKQARNKTKTFIAEARKTDKGYGRPTWYKVYLEEKEKLQAEGKSTKGLYALHKKRGCCK